MFQLKRSVVHPVQWILIVGTIGGGCFLYTNLPWPRANNQSENSSESLSISTNTTEPAAAEVTVDSGVPSLKTATWNINYANRDLAEVSRMLRESNADIVCLQETTEDSEAWLQRELAELFFAVNQTEIDHQHEVQAILKDIHITTRPDPVHFCHVEDLTIIYWSLRSIATKRRLRYPSAITTNCSIDEHPVGHLNTTENTQRTRHNSQEIRSHGSAIRRQFSRAVE